MNDLLKSIGEIRDIIEGIRDIDELSATISLLSGIVKQWGPADRADIGMLREVSNCLARLRLVLTRLEKDELWSKGASRAMAEQYAEVESAIRSLSHDLCDAMRMRER
jgi:hypothetical protein